MRPKASQLSLCAGVGLALVSLPTRGASFDDEGEFSFSPDAYFSESFESPPPPPDAGDEGGPPIEEDAGTGRKETTDALDGTHVFTLGEFDSQSWDVPLPAESVSLGATIWARGGEVVATLETEVDGRVDEFGVFYPTGRTTSDGWMELAMHGLTIDVSRAQGLVLGVFSPGGAEVDAAEIVVDGPAELGAECLGAADDSACTPSQVCMWGRCRNFGARVPPVPPAEWKNDLVDYLDLRFEQLYGPFKNRELDLPIARLELEAMRTASTPWEFWRHFRVAIHRLHDWHTTGSDIAGFNIENPRPISICFIEGNADLSQTQAPSNPNYLDVLVSHVGTGENTFGMKAGDRLVSVDGKHPIEWARSLVGVDFEFHTASNHVTYAEDVARLHRLISIFATKFEVVRCNPTTKVCSAPETLYPADVLPPGGEDTGVGCDNRPVLHVPNTPPSHPLGGFYSDIVKESNATEKIYGLQWSSLNVQPGSNLGTQLTNAVDMWRANARGVILDHRTGFGGTTAGSAYIWNFVQTPTPLDYFEFRQRSNQQPPTIAEGKLLFDQHVATNTVEIAGAANNPATDIPVALLIHLDGSASDWLPLGVKGSPNAKIFGPYQTAGAFSTLFSFGYWFGMGYSIAVGDTLYSDGRMLNGTGVEPDVVVQQKQSDLLAGKDTIYDVAIAWVRQGLKP